VGGAALALTGWLTLRDRVGPAPARWLLALLVWGGAAAASPLSLHPGDPAARLRAPGPALQAPPPGPRIVTPYTAFAADGRRAPDQHDHDGRASAALGNAAHNVRLRLDSLTTYASMMPRRLAWLGAAFGDRWPEAARRYALTHVVLEPPRTEAEQALHDAATSGGSALGDAGAARIWSVPHREWASFAPELRPAEGERAAVAAVVAAFQARSQAVVVESGVQLGVAPGRVLSVERGIEALRVEAEAAGDGTLVVADAWWPGWEATLDGRRVPLVRADALVRAVRWPPGRHVLEMRYRPPEVRRGALLSAAGLAVLAAWLALARRRTRPPLTR
jgi:hypothetical protein